MNSWDLVLFRGSGGFFFSSLSEGFVFQRQKKLFEFHKKIESVGIFVRLCVFLSICVLFWLLQLPLEFYLQVQSEGKRIRTNRKRNPHGKESANP